MDEQCIRGDRRGESGERLYSIRGGVRNSSDHTNRVHHNSYGVPERIMGISPVMMFKTPLVVPTEFMGTPLVCQNLLLRNG